MTIIATISKKERLQLTKKLKRLEAKYEATKPEATLKRKRIEKEAAGVMRKLDA